MLCSSTLCFFMECLGGSFSPFLFWFVCGDFLSFAVCFLKTERKMRERKKKERKEEKRKGMEFGGWEDLGGSGEGQL